MIRFIHHSLCPWCNFFSFCQKLNDTAMYRKLYKIPNNLYSYFLFVLFCLFIFCLVVSLIICLFHYLSFALLLWSFINVKLLLAPALGLTRSKILGNLDPKLCHAVQYTNLTSSCTPRRAEVAISSTRSARFSSSLWTLHIVVSSYISSSNIRIVIASCFDIHNSHFH